MNLLERRGLSLEEVIAQIPYARFLGITLERKGDEITTVMKFDDKLIGNPILPALHGGVIGSFMEMTAIAQVLFEGHYDALPKTINITIEYLRSGRPVDTYGQAIITKQGRRVANVRVEAWQQERRKPIAAAHCHFLLTP